MLNILGKNSNDQRIIGMSNELRSAMQTQQLQSLSQNNVPFPGMNKINLLKTQDMSAQDKNRLAREGLGDMLYHPTTNVMSASLIREKIDMDLEKNDALRASQIQVKIVSYKTPFGKVDNMPRRFEFRFRFFTFPEYRSG